MDNGEVCPAKKIAVVDGHAIIESSDSQGNYTKVYLDKRLKLNILKVFYQKNDIIVRHTSYSLTTVVTTTLNYNTKSNKGKVSRHIEERVLQGNEWNLMWSEYYKEISAADLPIVFDEFYTF